MFCSTLVAECAPTLAGIKTGNLFSCRMPCDTLRERVREINPLLTPRRIRLVVLKYGAELSLVYMYRPRFLQQDLEDAAAQDILAPLGYPLGSAELCVAYLAKRLNASGGFPHEIGLFLGYPPEDVAGFIENRAAGCKCVGTWKVYGDEQSARQKFALYRSCRDCYIENFRKYHSLDRLAVAVS